jgi:hypothetical protein
MKVLAALLLASAVALPVVNHLGKPAARPKADAPIPRMLNAQQIGAQQIKAQQFSIPAWAENPITSYYITLDAYTGWDVRIHAWPLFQDPPPPALPDPRNVAVQSSGRNSGAMYPIASGFSTPAAAIAWATVNLPGAILAH